MVWTIWMYYVTSLRIDIILHFPLLGSVINDQMRLHDLKCHHEEGQATRDLPPISVIYLYELALLRLEGVVACPGDMIIQN